MMSRVEVITSLAEATLRTARACGASVSPGYGRSCSGLAGSGRGGIGRCPATATTAGDHRHRADRREAHSC